MSHAANNPFLEAAEEQIVAHATGAAYVRPPVPVPSNLPQINLNDVFTPITADKSGSLPPVSPASLPGTYFNASHTLNSSFPALQPVKSGYSSNGLPQQFSGGNLPGGQSPGTNPSGMGLTPTISPPTKINYDAIMNMLPQEDISWMPEQGSAEVSGAYSMLNASVPSPLAEQAISQAQSPVRSHMSGTSSSCERNESAPGGALNPFSGMTQNTYASSNITGNDTFQDALHVPARNSPSGGSTTFRIPVNLTGTPGSQNTLVAANVTGNPAMTPDTFIPATVTGSLGAHSSIPVNTTGASNMAQDTFSIASNTTGASSMSQNISGTTSFATGTFNTYVPPATIDHSAPQPLPQIPVLNHQPSDNPSTGGVEVPILSQFPQAGPDTSHNSLGNSSSSPVTTHTESPVSVPSVASVGNPIPQNPSGGLPWDTYESDMAMAIALSLEESGDRPTPPLPVRSQPTQVRTLAPIPTPLPEPTRTQTVHVIPDYDNNHDDAPPPPYSAPDPEQAASIFTPHYSSTGGASSSFSRPMAAPALPRRPPTDTPNFSRPPGPLTSLPPRSRLSAPPHIPTHPVTYSRPAGPPPGMQRGVLPQRTANKYPGNSQVTYDATRTNGNSSNTAFQGLYGRSNPPPR
ncbi:hypothetical protein BABINDRAFT_163798 [Babjeviella inositovora NRRL Y-12698]|uniref:Uncharacterized protein n=1 Tax=Babjeviella inositovora NRRL Y-12698 TaxID=984486 RepID=A0A1E3QHZ5_9ASCO|nr:uncharacterized protein BABINDRAFT_163798 [Babjeviella inositovora NRRL Y-12698]ODQ77064.1 hypothetical protein BABINDRAFT_163798 [Babjeviella inositovora NRRL Y-12698]